MTFQSISQLTTSCSALKFFPGQTTGSTVYLLQAAPRNHLWLRRTKQKSIQKFCCRFGWGRLQANVSCRGMTARNSITLVFRIMLAALCALWFGQNLLLWGKQSGLYLAWFNSMFLPTEGVGFHSAPLDPLSFSHHSTFPSLSQRSTVRRQICTRVIFGEIPLFFDGTKKKEMDCLLFSY